MSENNIITSKHRFERKFFVTKLSIHEIQNLVKLHPAIFREIYCQRFINNIYFDSYNYNNYNENIEGTSNRIKIRIRWYGNLFGDIKTPVLEIKIKNGLLGKKKSIKISPFKFNNKTNISKILERIYLENNSLNIDFKSLKPTLLNRYSRNYFQSIDKRYRITIDDKQEFYHIKNHHNLFLNLIKDNRSVIMELKYDQKYDDNADYITTNFPYRLTKSSKYVNGLQILNQVF
jgi:SPX domain protein involved in polyphosphate accumulation